jgi:hypothetical protein
MIPLQFPLQVASVKFGLMVMDAGCEMVTAVNATQELASVTWAVYVPAGNPESGLTVEGAGGESQLTVYPGVPPCMLPVITEAAPVLWPKQFTLVLDTGVTLGPLAFPRGTETELVQPF